MEELEVEVVHDEKRRKESLSTPKSNSEAESLVRNDLKMGAVV